MKKVLSWILALAAVASCYGTIDPNNPNQAPDDNPDDKQEIPEEFVGSYTLSADKTEVEASGSDVVTFSLKDAYGRDILQDRRTLQKVNIVSEEGQRVPRMETTTTFIANGAYTFYATYEGRESKNKVRIVAQNRGNYEKFHKNVAIYKATATWCAPCALMTRALAGLNEDTKNHSVELCWHYQDNLAIYTDNASYDCGTQIASYFGNGGVPTVVLDLQTPVIEKSSSAIEAAAWDLRAKYPATCGIKVDTEYDAAEGNINVKAELTSSTGGEYDLGLALLLNDQIIPEGTNDGGKYSHIVRSATGNYMMYSTAIKSVPKDGTLPFEQSIMLRNMSPDNLSVVVFALVKEGDGARIDNIVEVKVGESIDYVYNGTGPVDPGDDPNEGNGNGGDDNPESGYGNVPEGTLRIFADKNKIAADGNEEVTFTIMYGSQDVSNAKTLQLIRTFEGDDKYMTYGANKFSTVTPGTYKFRAKYYYAGNHDSDNEVEVVAEQFFSGEEKNYLRRYFGTYFTSTGCTSCPLSAKGLKELQAARPGEISIASFHTHFNMTDPMTIPETDEFRAALGGFQGLPAFFWNMRKSSYFGGASTGLQYADSIEKESDEYQTYCGVAINTSYDKSSSRLDITAGITSNRPVVFRYLVLLVEDGIPAVGEYEQQSNSKLENYVHDNVVRKVLTGVSGNRLNDNLPLSVGVEAKASESVTLDAGWKAENMRVIVAAMTSDDGGYNWTVNNVNECKVGESVSYSYIDEE